MLIPEPPALLPGFYIISKSCASCYVTQVQQEGLFPIQRYEYNLTNCEYPLQYAELPSVTMIRIQNYECSNCTIEPMKRKSRPLRIYFR